MSNSLAIAAVSATLQSILTKAVGADPDLNDVVVTLQPLDKARGALTSNQLNLFLYQVLRSQRRGPIKTFRGRASRAESPAPLLPVESLVSGDRLRQGRRCDRAFWASVAGTGDECPQRLSDSRAPTIFARRPRWRCRALISTSRLSVCASPCSLSQWKIYPSCGQDSQPNTDCRPLTKYRWY